jgi:hypothetical protein
MQWECWRESRSAAEDGCGELASIAAFGIVKGKMTASISSNRLQILFVGGLASGAAFYLASLFG